MFDNVVFSQDTYEPLDHDHNAYWQSSELAAGFDETPDGAHDQLLAAAPAYQTGTFGGYYLPTSSPLFNAGSRTPAAAGLFHYTTQTAQTKEGGGHNVSIGIHYVAAGADGKPTDSDTPAPDGIPDYVENWHGDGHYEIHTDTETDWHNAQTVAGTPDASNTLYDDIDLDGDGMVGRIEKALGRLSLVPDNPLTLQVAAGGCPEFRKFKVPIDYDLLTGLADARLWFETGVEPEMQVLLRDTVDNSTLLVWNTTFDAPGRHLLQPRIYLKATFDGVAPITEAVGPLLAFESDNALQFEGLYSVFDGNGAILYAQTYPGTEYSIELRDGNGSHLRTISGTVPMDAGEIDVLWDLRGDDPNQTLYTGDNLTAIFTVTPPSSPSQTRSFVATRSALGFGEGNFTVAYRWSSLSGRGQPLDQCIQFGVADVLLTPAEGKNAYSSIFNDFTPIAPGYNQYGGAGYMADQGRVDALMDDLARVQNLTRNFYWYGHGSPSWIGCEPDINILASVLAARLGNDYEVVEPNPEGFPYIRSHRKHKYRFVFLDGCNAAKTGIWAEAFGISGKTLGYDKLMNHPEQAQAFLGFTDTVFSINSANACDWYRKTLFVFFSLWMRGRTPLQACFDTAGNKIALHNYLHDVLADDIALINTLPLGRPVGVAPQVNAYPTVEKIYGYPFITRDGIQPPE